MWVVRKGGAMKTRVPRPVVFEGLLQFEVSESQILDAVNEGLWHGVDGEPWHHLHQHQTEHKLHCQLTPFNEVSSVLLASWESRVCRLTERGKDEGVREGEIQPHLLERLVRSGLLRHCSICRGDRWVAGEQRSNRSTPACPSI